MFRTPRAYWLRQVSGKSDQLHCAAGTPVATDDSNPCTTDACNTSTGAVTHVPVSTGTSCSDGNACNGTETCNASGTCVAGTPVATDDSNPCTTDACNTSTGAVTHTPVSTGTTCSDGNACNGTETCSSAGACVAGTPVATDDSNPCTTDACNTSTGAVTHTPVSTGTSCSDGNACNGAETCNASGACAAGTPVATDDGNPCTTDACNTSTGAVTHTPASAGTSCSDGNACNGTETCNASGTCVAGTPVATDDGNSCTTDACSPSTGVTHTPVATGTSCSDGNACNGAETCNAAGACATGTPVATDDGNPCTTDACNSSTGAVTHTPVSTGTSCSDGNACNGAETCNATGTCVAGTAPTVNDNNPCTTDACAPASGVTHTPVTVGTSCSDGNACNGTETCDASAACVAGTPPVVDDSNPCTTDACNPTTGVSHAPKTSGTSCSDGNACNGSETCNSTGTCVAGAPINVNDNNACTTDSCDPVSGTVTHTPVTAGTACPDNNACNGTETCNASGSCVAGAPPSLDDGNSCTTDTCDPATGPVHTPTANGSSCSDGNLCNGTETCQAGACRAGTPVNVDDGKSCTLDACDPATGTVTHVLLAAGADCSDGNVCNGAKRCDASGSCLAGPPPQLTDDNDCTIDSCDPVLGVLHAPLPAGSACADSCASGTCDASARCVTPPVYSLDDGNPCTVDTCLNGAIHHDPQAGISCDDGNPCNGFELCSATGACVSDHTTSLSDDNPCTVDTCDPVLGVQHSPVAAGSSCSDGDPCNGDEVCSGTGVCAHGVPVAVDDHNPCTVDACAPGLGTVTHRPVPTGIACSDGDACNGLEVCNAAGTCQPGTPPALDDGIACTFDDCDPELGVMHTPNGDPTCVARMDWTVDVGGSEPSPRDSFTSGMSADGDLVLFGGNNAGAVSSDTWVWHSDLELWEARNATNVHPLPRAAAAGAVDTGRNRLIVFGGVNKALNSSLMSDVWEYDIENRAWTAGPSTGGPSARAYAAAAYDSARGRMLFFGGAGAADSGETWAYLSASHAWQLLSSTGPSPRYGAALAYDPEQDRFVLFGGTVSTASGVALVDTWTFDPGSNTWAQVTSTPAPLGRTAHALAYDPDSRRVVLYGGTGAGNSALTDVWLFDTGARTWAELPAAGTAPARAGHALVYDPWKHALVAVGGLEYSVSGRSTPQHVDLWALDVSGNPPGWSSLRGDAPVRLRETAAYDTVRGQLVAVDAPSGQGTWVATSTSNAWSGPVITGDFIDQVNTSATLVYDARRARVLAVWSLLSTPLPDFGVLQVSEWDGSAWTPGCRLPNQFQAGYGPASDASIAFDETTGKILIFGGIRFYWPDPRQGQIQQTSAIRVLDPVTCTAYEEMPTQQPPSRVYAASVYVPVEDRLYVFGGADTPDLGYTFNPIGGTWAYDFAQHQWLEFTGTMPSPRRTARIAFDSARRKLVLGPTSDGGTTDTWELDLSTHSWTEVSADDPAVHGPGAFAFDSQLNRVVNVDVAGRRSAWNGAAWEPLFQTRAPGARSGASAVYFPNAAATVLFGGTAGNGRRELLQDTWVYRGAWSMRDFSQRDPSLGGLPPVPDPRTGHAFAAGTQAGGEFGLLVGGETDAGLLGDTWTLDPSTLLWSKLGATTTPRTQHALAPVPATGFVIFGGLGADGPLQQTQLFDARVGSWSFFPGSSEPPARYAHAMATDAQANKVVLFGGRDANTVFGDTWILDLSNLAAGWQKPNPAHPPRARFGHAMTYDSVRKKVLLTGGESSVPGTALGDTWEWDMATSTWRAIPVAEYDGRAGESAWFDPVGAELVTFGGLAHQDQGEVAFTFGETLRLGHLDRATAAGWAEDGIACSSDGECGSGFCVDGYCCNSRCGEECAACDMPGHEGVCSPSTGQPHGTRTACAGDHSACAMECLGTDTAACHFAPSGTVCGNEQLNTCFGNGLITAPSECDGAGICASPSIQSCQQYYCCKDCEPNSCLTTCHSGGLDDCTDKANYYCNAGHQCVPIEKMSDITVAPATLTDRHANQPLTLSIDVNFTGEFQYTCTDQIQRSTVVCDWNPSPVCVGSVPVPALYICTVKARHVGSQQLVGSRTTNSFLVYP